mmetsp:Transcript_27503/g.62318  ORF Transcript_27503/g.62318 Transcript_27503/m.62318 type:complete len:250 (-) Transcript_27503:548-1297(-)
MVLRCSTGGRTCTTPSSLRRRRTTGALWRRPRATPRCSMGRRSTEVWSGLRGMVGLLGQTPPTLSGASRPSLGARPPPQCRRCRYPEALAARPWVSTMGSSGTSRTAMRMKQHRGRWKLAKCLYRSPQHDPLPSLFPTAKHSWSPTSWRPYWGWARRAGRASGHRGGGQQGSGSYRLFRYRRSPWQLRLLKSGRRLRGTSPSPCRLVLLRHRKRPWLPWRSSRLLADHLEAQSVGSPRRVRQRTGPCGT